MTADDMELPEIKTVERFEVRPGDRFVITFAGEFTHISENDAVTIKGRAAAALGVDPDRILLLARASLTVVSPDA